MPRALPFAAALAVALAVAPAVAVADVVDRHERSWLHRTLEFQYRLGSALPLHSAQWLGTHNSFNTTAEPPTLSGQDPNQRISLTDQLRLDMRSLELDAHYVPSLRDGGRREVLLCHARGEREAHAGCTTERPMSERLAEIRAWLDDNPREVLLLYVEDHLEGRAGHDAAAAALEGALGPHLFRPVGASGACVPMPLELTRRRIRRSGARVLVISGCGPDGTAWRGVAFDDAERERHESGPEGARPYPACAPGPGDLGRGNRFHRVFEDSTRLGATLGAAGGPPARLTPRVTRQLTGCGVELLGFDLLVPGDARLPAAVWSWAEGHPRVRAGASCAVQRAADGRWRSSRCGARRAFACRDPRSGRWSVDARPAPFRVGSRARCAGPPRFAVPRSGLEAQRLRDAMLSAGVAATWVRTGAEPRVSRGSASRPRPARLP